MHALMPYIAWFEDVTRDSLPLVGGKAANLGEITHAGLPVPPGFVVTTHAFRGFLGSDGLRGVIRDRLKRLDVDDPGALRAASEAVQKLILGEPEPPELRRAVLAAYASLGERTGGAEPLVAVRSSATVEDTAQYSFAGMFQSFLAVRGADELIRSVKACWASLFGARVLFYRVKHGLVEGEQLIAAIVQKMIDAEKSGVMFTVDPASGNPDVIVIESTWGLGEAVVGGQVRPDRFVVAKRTLEIVERTINRKDLEIVRASERGATIERAVPPERRQAASLTDGEVRAVAELGRRAEEHYRSPQDLEFAIDQGQVYLVQTRPVTTPIASAPPSRRVSPAGAARAILHGLGASPGFVAGRVRVLRSPAEGAKLERGEILVAPMTTPDWVPFMRRAAAIITDSGGMTSHAAIVSRELGLPCIVGTQIATSTLTDGMVVTVAATNGSIYAGRELGAERRPPAAPGGGLGGRRAADRNFDLGEPRRAGAGGRGRRPARRRRGALARRVHDPRRARRHAPAAPPRTRAAGHVRGARRRQLEHDRQGLPSATGGLPQYGFPLERVPRPRRRRALRAAEANPMIGYRGCFRYTREPELFNLELQVLERVRGAFDNVHLMIPFVRTPRDFDECRRLVEASRLRRQRNFKLWIMAEVPSVVHWLPTYARGIDGVSIGSNDLTQLVLGVDRDSAVVSPLFDERDGAVLAAIRAIVEKSHESGLTCSICGQAPSIHPEYRRDPRALGHRLDLGHAGCDRGDAAPRRRRRAAPPARRGSPPAADQRIAASLRAAFATGGRGRSGRRARAFRPSACLGRGRRGGGSLAGASARRRSTARRARSNRARRASSPSARSSAPGRGRRR